MAITLDTVIEGFRSEAHVDWNKDENRECMRRALTSVESMLGRVYVPMIGGEPHYAPNPKMIYSYDPATQFQQKAEPYPLGGEVLVGAVQCVGPDALAKVVVASGSSEAKKWLSDPELRRDTLLRVAGEFRAKKFELAAWVVFEVNKSWDDAVGEVEEAIDFLVLYANSIEFYAYPEILASHIRAEINFLRWIPRGITAGICSWNFPVSNVVEKLASSLSAGCPILLKPAEQAPICAWKAIECFLKAGVPASCISYLPGDHTLGRMLVASEDVSQIAFTGSRSAGMDIWQNAASHPARGGFKSSDLELGGNNPIIVCQSAIRDHAIREIIRSKFGFCGQKCSALQRLIFAGSPDDGTIKDIRMGVIEGARSIEIGHPRDPHFRYGAVADREAYIRLIITICELSRLTSSSHIVSGVSYMRGFFVNPAIFEGVPHNLPQVQNEIFGPVLLVFYCRTLEDAVALANDTPFALTAGIFSERPKELDYFEKNIRAGNVYKNRAITGAMVGRQPFGGFKFSGHGHKVGTPRRLEAYLHEQSISENTERYGALLK